MSGNEAVKIRRASSADAETLAALSIDTFNETFGHMYSAEDLDAYLRSAYTVDGYRNALDEQGCAAWLLEDGSGRAQGYAFVGPAGLPHAEVRPGDMELKRLYLRKDAQNGGQGGALFDAAEAWLRANGPDSIWIGVWSRNLGAQRFYERRGYQRAGEYFFPVGEARDLEFILRKRLG